MKIIERGEIPEEKVHRVKCNRCKSLIEFKQGEAKYTSEQRDGDYLSISCPVCSSTITKLV